jgi:hypothetical protein
MPFFEIAIAAAITLFRQHSIFDRRELVSARSNVCHHWSSRHRSLSLQMPLKKILAIMAVG